MKQAYITLLSSVNYLPAIIILNESLKNVNSKYPLIVLIVDNIYDQVINSLKELEILTLKVPYISYSEEIQNQFKGKDILNTASKLNIFLLDEIDKLVYLDADSFILQNIDDVFNYPDGSLLVDGENFNEGFSGLFVFSPKNHYYDWYVNLIQSFPILDGDLFGKLWFPFKTNINYQIPCQYFFNITIENIDMWDLTKIKAIHFCYHYKPWNYDTVEDYLKDYLKEFPQKSINRKKILNFYFQKYLIPLRRKGSENI